MGTIHAPTTMSKFWQVTYPSSPTEVDHIFFYPTFFVFLKTWRPFLSNKHSDAHLTHGGNLLLICSDM